jgi:F-type H+-transporting ATPase subunit gamma
VIGTDRGLCGGYNSNILRETRAIMKEAKKRNESITLLPFGRKIQNALYKQLPNDCIRLSKDVKAHKKGRLLCDIQESADEILDLIKTGVVGKVFVLTGYLQNLMTQPIVKHQLVPFVRSEKTKEKGYVQPFSLFEPRPETLIPSMLSHNFIVQLFGYFLENDACEQAARMTAMDNATRNAKEIIHLLKLKYNQGRQAAITKEIIEIVAGAQVL